MTVKCLLSVELADCHGHNLQYMLAADDTQHLHLILQGQIVTSFVTPAPVTAVRTVALREGVSIRLESKRDES